MREGLSHPVPFLGREASEPESLLTAHQWARSAEGLSYLFSTAPLFFFLVHFFFLTLGPNHCIIHHCSKTILKEDLPSMLTSAFLHIIFIGLRWDFLAVIVVLWSETQESLNPFLPNHYNSWRFPRKHYAQRTIANFEPEYHFVGVWVILSNLHRGLSDQKWAGK